MKEVGVEEAPCGLMRWTRSWVRSQRAAVLSKRHLKKTKGILCFYLLLHIHVRLLPRQHFTAMLRDM